MIKPVVQQFSRVIFNAFTKREFQKQSFVAINERPNEYRFVFESLAILCPRDVLDVGTGTTALPSLMRSCGFMVTALDNIRDYWPSGMVNRHFYVIDDDITKPRMDQKFDVITCISVLEHVRDHVGAMKSMAGLLKPGGHLVLTCPYNDKKYSTNVYEIPGSNAFGKKIAFTTQAFSGTELEQWCREAGFRVVKQEFWRYFTGEYWTVGERVLPPQQTTKEQPHQISLLLLQKVQ